MSLLERTELGVDQGERRDRLPVGAPLVVAGLGDRRLAATAGRDDVQAVVGVDDGVEDDLGAVGRPGRGRVVGGGVVGDIQRRPMPSASMTMISTSSPVVRGERDLRAVGRPVRIEVVGVVGRRRDDPGPVDVHRVDLEVAAPVGGERDLGAVRRHGRVQVERGIRGQPLDVGAIDLHRVDVDGAVALGGEHDPGTVRGPVRREVAGGVRGQALDARPGLGHHVDVVGAVVDRGRSGRGRTR